MAKWLYSYSGNKVLKYTVFIKTYSWTKKIIYWIIHKYYLDNTVCNTYTVTESLYSTVKAGIFKSQEDRSQVARVPRELITACRGCDKHLLNAKCHSTVCVLLALTL